MGGGGYLSDITMFTVMDVIFGEKCFLKEPLMSTVEHSDGAA